MTFRHAQRWVMAAALLLSFALIPAAHAATVRMVVMGDSLTSGYQLKDSEGFAAILQRYAAARGYNLRVISRSSVGATTKDAYYDTNEVLAARPDIILIALGTNDILGGMDPTRETYHYLNAIIYQLQKGSAASIVIAGVKAPSTVPKGKARELGRIYYALAQNRGFPLYKNLMEGVEGNAKLQLDDRFHPNALGVRVMVQNIFPTLEPLIRWKTKMAKYNEEQGL